MNGREAELGFSPRRPIADDEYYLRRAEAELQLAESAATSRSAEVHHALASAYLGRVFSEDRPGPIDMWRWLHAAREKREAIRSIFVSASARLGSEDSPTPDEDLARLLDRL